MKIVNTPMQWLELQRNDGKVYIIRPWLFDEIRESKEMLSLKEFEDKYAYTKQ